MQKNSFSLDRLFPLNGRGLYICTCGPPYYFLIDIFFRRGFSNVHVGHRRECGWSVGRVWRVGGSEVGRGGPEVDGGGGGGGLRRGGDCLSGGGRGWGGGGGRVAVEA